MRRFDKSEECHPKQREVYAKLATTIAEAEAAGYAMPITSDHWLYPYMHDADGDGTVEP